ncbi:MAG: gliding motility-associated C-terminal domain-containing protein [Candidatus Latescibacterota bacterium]|nr:gliding motility-associated C-terminal domain-containing protein [Candidatus Latescibacterota bacterium]
MAFRAFQAWVGCALLWLSGASAEQIRYDTARQWRAWSLPLGVVELAAPGVVRPVEIRKNIDPLRNAAAFDGGIRAAGSNPQTASRAIDGDPLTGWSPDSDDDPADWWIEIDLGRAVAARRVSLVFLDTAPPFALFDLFLSTGEPAIDVVANPIEGTLIYRVKERFKENDRYRVAIELDPVRDPMLQFLRIEALTHIPGAELVGVEVEAIGDNIALDLLAKGGGLELIVDIDGFGNAASFANVLPLADGRFSLWSENRRINRSVNVISRMTLDLGAVFWVDLVRIVADFLSRPGQFRFNFDTYEVLTSDGSLAPNGTRIWQKQFAGKATQANRRLGIANHHFASIKTRYVRIEWVFWDAACAAACVGCGIVPPCQFWGGTRELQVFGAGFPSRVVLDSPLIDLGGDQQVQTIRWGGDAPLGTQVEVQSRTGNELQLEITYRDKNGKEVTERKYDKLIPSFKGRIDTAFSAGGDWSPWSKKYLVPGDAFQSPSPRRYMELEVALASEQPASGAALDWLEIEFDDPLAQEVLGEIFPVEVQPGERTEFAYFIRPRQVVGTGFDRLVVEASASVEFAGVFVGGEVLAAEAESTEAGFAVTLAEPIRRSELVELRFAGTVFVDATRFDAFIADSSADALARQRVDAGDANAEVESSTTAVRLPVGQRLLANVSMGPRVFSPNGDGINDALWVEFDLVNVLVPRRVGLRIYDLTGRLVWVGEEAGQAGSRALVWDGCGAGGVRVVPGIYVAELRIDGDEGSQARWRVISVVY